MSVVFFLPFDPAQGGSGGSHPTPIPRADPQLLLGDFPRTKPRKLSQDFLFLGFFLEGGCSILPAANPHLKGGNESKNLQERNKTFQQHFPLFPNLRRRDVNSLQEAPGKFVTSEVLPFTIHEDAAGNSLGNIRAGGWDSLPGIKAGSGFWLPRAPKK